MNTFDSNRVFEKKWDEIINKEVFSDYEVERIEALADQKKIGDWWVSYGGQRESQERKYEEEIHNGRFWKNNFPFEIYSNYPNKNGWAVHLESDQLLFGFTDVKQFTIFDWKALKQWGMENCERYPLKQQQKHYQKNDTRFYAIPFKDIPEKLYRLTFHLDNDNNAVIAGKDEFVVAISTR